MNKEQMIKQAYVRGLAARGILRMRAMQKQAAPYDVPLPPGGLVMPPTMKSKTKLPRALKQLMSMPPADNQNESWSRLATDAISGVGGAGIGALIGALVAYARKKRVLGHALAGAGIGGLAGIGGSELYRYLKGNKGDSPVKLEEIPDPNEMTPAEMQTALEYGLNSPNALSASVYNDNPLA